RQPDTVGGGRSRREPHRAGLVQLLFPTAGSRRRATMWPCIRTTPFVASAPRHKLAGSGYRRFPMPVVFGELGVLSCMVARVRHAADADGSIASRGMTRR